MKKGKKLKLITKAGRSPLSPEEVAYWKRHLDSILKVGFEHEFNLKTSKGKCNGTSIICPCNNPKKHVEECYKVCVLTNNCPHITDPDECPGIYCIEFVSPCPTCKDAIRDCSLCEFFKDPNKDPPKVRATLSDKLKPTYDLTRTGTSGVLEITTDGSLEGDGGVEIVTVGRRVNFNAFFDQAKNIIDLCKEHGGYVNERTGMHMHLVAGYFILSNDTRGVYCKKNTTRYGDSVSELESPMPEIILANFHQIIRKYHNALVWLTSAGTHANHITRWTKFRKSILKYSSVAKNMKSVINEIARNQSHQGRYALINYTNVVFAKGLKEISRLHIEARYADQILSPGAVAALGVLLYAILLKAVVLSQYGVLTMNSEYLSEAFAIQETLLNNDGSYEGNRKANTQSFSIYKETVKDQALELIKFLTPELKKHGKAKQILERLAESPCSSRLIKGHSWEKIEKDLTKRPGTKRTLIHNTIMRTIDTGYISNCDTEDEWINGLVEETQRFKKESIKNYLDQLIKDSTIEWHFRTGTYIRSS